MPLRQIQIYDADPAAALITQRGLQAHLGESVNVVVAPSPNAAWLACAHGNVDLLIVDPSPHSSSAAALVRAVRVYRPRTSVLVLTAYDTPGLRAKMRDLGVDYYVPKPVDLRELLQVVSKAMPLVAPADEPGNFALGRPGPAPI